MLHGRGHAELDVRKQRVNATDELFRGNEPANLPTSDAECLARARAGHCSVPHSVKGSEVNMSWWWRGFGRDIPRNHCRHLKLLFISIDYVLVYLVRYHRYLRITTNNPCELLHFLEGEHFARGVMWCVENYGTCSWRNCCLEFFNVKLPIPVSQVERHRYWFTSGKLHLSQIQIEEWFNEKNLIPWLYKGCQRQKQGLAASNCNCNFGHGIHRSIQVRRISRGESSHKIGMPFRPCVLIVAKSNCLRR
mmetsp:Transcript_26767/g.64922  ORF Transcript_26767/g.64922 Transcript_26767/m.64922 type:complete len:249 (-) Transcript_26767:403-1149(-)